MVVMAFFIYIIFCYFVHFYLDPFYFFVPQLKHLSYLGNSSNLLFF